MAEHSTNEIQSNFLSGNKKVSEMTSYLTQSHVFIIYSKKSRKRILLLYFSENLQKLIFEINKQTRKIVLLADIYYAEAGVSKELLELYKEDLKGLYGLTIVTKKRAIELSAMHKIDRDLFIKNVNQLIMIMKEWSGTNGLRIYFTKKLESTDRTLINSSKHPEDEIEFQIIKSSLDEILCKIELTHFTSLKKTLNNDLKLIEYENKYLSDQYDLLKKKTRERDKSLEIVQSNHTFLNHKFYIFSLINKSEKNREKFKYWAKILPFCNCVELKQLAGVSKWLKKLTKKFLKNQSNWRHLCFTSLHPRMIFWDIYLQTFSPVVKSKSIHYSSDVNEEIRKDVIRGLPDKLEVVEEILKVICSSNSEVGYCQGMQVVTHFLVTVFNDKEKVVSILNILMDPPYYMGEIWKKGLCRLKLAVYQLEVLVEMKFPLLLQHLRNLELNIETLVTPWIVTVFTQMFYQKHMSRGSLIQIWDMFIVIGWPALIASCLGMFYLLLGKIMNTNFEDTMSCFTSDLPYLTSNTAKKFLVDQKFLDVLEESFNSQN